jgi:hypothetical protein
MTHSASGSQENLYLFAKFIELTSASEPWMFVNGDPPFGSLQFAASDVETACLELNR